LTWYGALIAVNLQTAFLSPPVAMSAYYLRNVMPQWSMGTIYKGMADFMVIQIICLLAVLFWPDIALWLPRGLRSRPARTSGQDEPPDRAGRRGSSHVPVAARIRPDLRMIEAVGAFEGVVGFAGAVLQDHIGKPVVVEVADVNCLTIARKGARCIHHLA